METNKNGRQIIEAIVRRLNDLDIRCYDTEIVSKLASLDKYEISQLTTTGDIDIWVKERKKLKR